MLLNYSKSHELRGGERDSLIGGVEMYIAKEHTYIHSRMDGICAFLKFDT